MRKIYFTLSLFLSFSLLFAQNKEEAVNVKNSSAVVNGVTVSHKYLGPELSSENMVTRKVLHEEATNTYCGPCANNNPIAQQFWQRNPDSLVVITYHAWWPGSGDPMYQANTTQNGDRINYYNINGVPSLFIDGIIAAAYPFTQANLQSTYNLRKGVLTPITIEAVDQQVAYDSLRSTVTVEVQQDPGAGDFRLQLFAIEKEIHYTSAPGSNGEKDFYYVFRKASPSTQGVVLNTEIGTHEYTFTFQTEETWVDSMIYCAAFVQEDNSKEVFNANNSERISFPMTFFHKSPGNKLGNIIPGPIDIVWTIPDDLDHFRLQVSDNPDFSSFLVSEDNLTTDTYNFDGIVEGGMYYWRMKGFNSSDSTEYTDTWAFAGMLNAPDSLQAASGDNKIMLTWNDHSNGETAYAIERAHQKMGSTIFFKPHDTTYTGTTYDDTDIEHDKTYWYRVYAINDYSYSDFSDTTEMTGIVVGVDEDNITPQEYSLRQNYPNPFNPSTKINWSVAERGIVKLTVFNALGQQVRVLFQGDTTPGNYETEFNAEGLPSGVYFLDLNAGQFRKSIKMVLTK